MKEITYPVGYTDYPLGDDVPGEEAPIRLCWIIGYDRNKYVQIQAVGLDGTHSIKRGYVYKAHSRLTAEGPDPERYGHDELIDLLRDNCQKCNGDRNGVLGNENVIDGIVMCDWCSHDYSVAKRAA